MAGSKLAEAYVVIRTQQDNLAKEMSRARGTVERGMKAAGQSGSDAMSGIFQGIGQTIAATAFSAVTNGLREMVSAFVEANAQFESYEVALGTMLGSTERAGALMADLKDFALLTPFELTGLVEGTQRLLAFGFQAEDIIPIMHRVGEVVSAMPGATAEKVNNVIHAIGQMKTAGKVFARDINTLVRNGIPAWQALADEVGMTVAQVRKAVTKGQIDSATGIRAVLKIAEDPRFAGGMEKQSKTFRGIMSNFNDLMWQMAAELGKPLFEAMKGAMTDLVSYLQSDAGKSIGASIKSVVSTVASAVGPITQAFLKFGPTIAQAAGYFALLAGAVPAVTAAFGAVASVVTFIWSKLSPLNLLVSTLAISLYKAFNDPSIGGPMMDTLAGASAGVDSFMTGVMDLWNSVSAAFGGLTDSIGGVLASIITNVASFVSSNAGTFGYWVSLVGEIIGGLIKTITELFDGLVGYLGPLLSMFWGQVGDGATSTWGYIAAFIGGVLEVIAVSLNNALLTAKIIFKSWEYIARLAWEGIQKAFWITIGAIVGGWYYVVSVISDVCNNAVAIWDETINTIRALFAGLYAMWQALWSGKNVWTGFQRGFDAELKRLRDKSAKMRDIGANAGKAFDDGFRSVVGPTGFQVDAGSQRAREELGDLVDQWVDAGEKMRRARAERLKPGEKPADGAGRALGKPGMPGGLESAAAGGADDKTKFVGLAEMWKKIQENVAGAKMLDLAKQTANNTAKTADSAERTATDIAGTRRAVEKMNTGLE